MREQTHVKPGDRFNLLTAVRYVRTGKHYRRYFLFHCDCGGEITITVESAVSGNTKSCGCLRQVSAHSKRLPENGAVINHIILQYKRHANDRGIGFHLPRSVVSHLVRQPCHYCGDPHGNLKKTKNCREGFPHNGLDRIDSGLPYIEANVVPCCGRCNKAKGTAPRDDFIAWARRVAAHATQWGELDANARQTL
jgi:hypothetical protein